MYVPRFLDDLINDFRKGAEEQRYLNIYSNPDPIYLDDPTGFRNVDGFHVIIFMSQEYMLEQEMLENRWPASDRVDMSKMFDQWLKENIRGFYQVWQWGNGYGNRFQRVAGIWHMQIWCAREEDALAIKLRWF